MHPYGTDTNERRTVFIVLVPISFLLSNRVLTLVASFGLDIPKSLDWIFDPGSAAAWYLFLSWLVDQHVWKKQDWPVRQLGLISTPDLNGVWRGELRSSYKPEGKEPFETPYPVEIEIKQTWTRMVIEMRHPGSSESRSESASLFLDRGVNPILVYTYWNRPEVNQIHTMEAHSGTAELTLENNHTLTGKYYNGRGRGNYGKMEVRR